MDDHHLRERYQEATRRASGERRGCPGGEELSHLAAGSLEGSRRETLLDHVTLCHECSVELRAALSLKEWAREAGGSRWPSGSAWRFGLAVAAVLVVVVGSLSLFAPEAQAPSSRYRDAGSGSVRSLLQEDVALPRDDFLLRWSPGPEGSTYELRVTDESLALLYRARSLDEPEHRVPEAALTAIPSGTRLFWQVECREPSGQRTASAGFFVRVR